MTRTRLGRALLMLAGATALGVVSAYEAIHYQVIVGTPTGPWHQYVLVSFGYWYLWAALVLPLGWFARRFPLDRAGWRRHLPLHLLAMVGVSLAQITLWHLLMLLAAWLKGRPVPFWATLQLGILRYNDWTLIGYWAIVGTATGWRHHRESQRQALAAAALRRRLAEAQLQVLQQQLHPPFLLGALDAIADRTARDPKAAERMLLQLAALLRRLLDGTAGQQVPLREELELLRPYLEIERARWQERLTLTVDVPEALGGTRVPRLVLQPLLDSVVRHGLAGAAAGEVQLRAGTDAAGLWIEVRALGATAATAALDALRGDAGLLNARARLERLYGAAHHVDLTAEGGLRLRVTLPA